MPPKAKFTKEQITNAALELVKENGIDRLTARTLAKKLGSSSCPIFTVFENMEEVQKAVIEHAKDCYKGYVEKGLSEPCAFQGVGTQYILFAIQEPKLFQLLFMREQISVPSLDRILPLIEDNYEKILTSITEGYGLDRKTAKKLYLHLWIYSHGIAALCATRMCRFTGTEINEMISEVFISLLNNPEIKTHKQKAKPGGKQYGFMERI